MTTGVVPAEYNAPLGEAVVKTWFTRRNTRRVNSNSLNSTSAPRLLVASATLWVVLLKVATPKLVLLRGLALSFRNR